MAQMVGPGSRVRAAMMLPSPHLPMSVMVEAAVPPDGAREAAHSVASPPRCWDWQCWDYVVADSRFVRCVGAASSQASPSQSPSKHCRSHRRLRGGRAAEQHVRAPSKQSRSHRRLRRRAPQHADRATVEALRCAFGHWRCQCPVPR